MPQRWNQQLAVFSLMFLGSFLFSLRGGAEVLEYLPDYYTVNEPDPPIQEPFLDPMEVLSEMTERAQQMAVLDLMSWFHHQEELEAPLIPYNRKAHYGTWVRDPRDGTCYNTRAKVLIRSSEVPVSFNSRGCTVVAGMWLDPYSNRHYSQASDLQVDHVVPLKNSYVSGGWKWDADKRCLYANFISNKYHLLAVNGPDNMRKGDRTPEGFMPPNESYACEYLMIWLKIKLIWNLAMVPSEAHSISDLVKQYHCDPALLSMRLHELNQQRSQILENRELCSASH